MNRKTKKTLDTLDTIKIYRITQLVNILEYDFISSHVKENELNVIVQPDEQYITYYGVDKINSEYETATELFSLDKYKTEWYYMHYDELLDAIKNRFYIYEEYNKLKNSGIFEIKYCVRDKEVTAIASIYRGSWYKCKEELLNHITSMNFSFEDLSKAENINDTDMKINIADGSYYLIQYVGKED